MPSPFPGMNPYLEKPSGWPDVHHELILATRAAIKAQIGPKYHVQIEERIYISNDNDPGRIVLAPDIQVSSRDVDARSLTTAAEGGIDVAELLVLKTASLYLVHVSDSSTTAWSGFGRSVCRNALGNPNSAPREDDDAPLDLQAVLDTAYDQRTGYETDIDYRRAGCHRLVLIGTSGPSDGCVKKDCDLTKHRDELFYTNSPRNTVTAWPDQDHARPRDSNPDHSRRGRKPGGRSAADRALLGPVRTQAAMGRAATTDLRRRRPGARRNGKQNSQPRELDRLVTITPRTGNCSGRGYPGGVVEPVPRSRRTRPKIKPITTCKLDRGPQCRPQLNELAASR